MVDKKKEMENALRYLENQKKYYLKQLDAIETLLFVLIEDYKKQEFYEVVDKK